jgi:hypothetical protein
MARAVPIVLGSLGLGILAQLLFFDVGIGLNLPLAVAALLGAGWSVRDRSQAGPRPTDWWLPVTRCSWPRSWRYVATRPWSSWTCSARSH